MLECSSTVLSASVQSPLCALRRLDIDVKKNWGMGVRGCNDRLRQLRQNNMLAFHRLKMKKPDYAI